MIFFTGDIHRNVNGVADFINKVHPTMEDVIVLLGDVGANYYNGRKDYLMKQWLNAVSYTHLTLPTTVPV